MDKDRADSPKQVYDESHAPDPVAVRAREDAVAVTDNQEAHPWLNRFLIVFAILILIVGTFGAVVSTINSIQLKHQTEQLQAQNAELHRQQVCIIKLIRVSAKEQKARSHIATDDRQAIRDLVHNVSHAKSPEDVQKAFHLYNVENARNDARRAQNPIPTFDLNVCDLSSTNIIPSRTPTPTSTDVPSGTPTAHNSLHNHKPGHSPSPTSSNGATHPQAAPGAPRTVTRTNPGTHTTQTVTRTPRPSQSHSPTLAPSTSPNPGVARPVVQSVCHELPTLPLIGPVC